MSSLRLPLEIFIFLTVTWALPRPPVLDSASSGAGEIPDDLILEHRPFGEPLGKEHLDNEVFNNYDLDSDGAPGIFPEYDENEIHPPPQGGGARRPLKPNDGIPEEKHPEDEPKEDPEEEEDHEPPSHEIPRGGEETHGDEEEEEERGAEEGEEEESRRPEGDDTHAVEDEDKPQGSGENETQEGEEDASLPFDSAIFTFKQVNHYIKQLEEAMEHVFKETLEEAALLNNTFANTTEEEVEVDGHKYKVHKSLIKTGGGDRNSTLLIEAISAVGEDEPKNNRSERSNPDAEPIEEHK